jgi:hypothetical protein
MSLQKRKRRPARGGVTRKDHVVRSECEWSARCAGQCPNVLGSARFALVDATGFVVAVVADVVAARGLLRGRLS